MKSFFWSYFTSKLPNAWSLCSLWRLKVATVSCGHGEAARVLLRRRGWKFSSSEESFRLCNGASHVCAEASLGLLMPFKGIQMSLLVLWKRNRSDIFWLKQIFWKHAESVGRHGASAGLRRPAGERGCPLVSWFQLTTGGMVPEQYLHGYWNSHTIYCKCKAHLACGMS